MKNCSNRCRGILRRRRAAAKIHSTPSVQLKLASLRQTAEIIRGGGVVAYPTEACFGLGCDPRNSAAIARILRMKHRARAQGLLLLADRRTRFAGYVNSWGEHRAEIFASWPGPYTWLLPAGARASRWVRGDHRTIGVRVTAHRAAAALSRLCGLPIVSTSANRSGRKMLRTARAVLQEFGAEIDGVMDARIGHRVAPSVIRDGATLRVLRG